ncbi:MAG: nitroreductase family protein [Treponema sp.]|jgi:nitroreductase|nr:nitroreductase family protein [Treponema sp.]
MTFTEALRARRSIRSYRAGDLTQAQIDALLEAAMLAPSANNSRPWDFIVVRSRETLDKIADLHPYAKMLKEAPLAIVICIRELSPFSPQDCGAAAENLLLAAADLGLGACWCGVYPRPELIAALQKTLGTEAIPFNVIAVGYPNESPKQRGLYDASRVTWV